MKFWIFMLVMNLLIPLTMIIFGYIYNKKPPQKPKSKFAYSGYRTPMSMKKPGNMQIDFLVSSGLDSVLQ